MAAEKREVGCARGIQGSRTEPEWLEMAECVDGGGIERYRFVRSFSKKNAGGKTKVRVHKFFSSRIRDIFFEKSLVFERNDPDRNCNFNLIFRGKGLD